MKSNINFTTVEGIKAYALSRYELGGHWIIECWSEEDIQQFIKHNGNGRQVRTKLCKMIKDWNAEAREYALA